MIVKKTLETQKVTYGCDRLTFVLINYTIQSSR
jgi:hypothetical protein